MLHLFRDKKKTYIIWVAVVVGTILSFVIGFNFLFGTGAGNQGAPTDYLGSVAGEHITREQFEAAFRNNIANYRQQTGREPDDATLAYMRDQTWSNLVGQMALNREAQKLGLGASDREVVFAVKNMPPQEVIDLPAFQTDGQFDMRKYRQVMADTRPEVGQFWASVEAYQRTSLPTQKLQALGASLAKVTDPEIVTAYARSNDKAVVQLIGFPVTEDTVSARTLPQADLQAWYDKHKEEFRREDEASLVLVLIPKTSTPADARLAGENAQSIYRDAIKDSSFVTYAQQNSDEQVPAIPSGLPGRLVEKGQLLHNLEDAVFALQPGEVTAPILSENAYHIVKYIGPVEDAGKAKRHIVDLVVQVKPGSESLETAHSTLDRVRTAAEKQGLARAASAAKLEAHTTGWFTQDEPPSALFQLNDVVTFAFSVKKGTLSRIIDKPGAFLLVQVVDRRPAGIRSLAEEESVVRERVALEKGLDKAETKAKAALQAVSEAGSMEAAAAKMGRGVANPPTFTRSGPFGPELQSEPRVVGAAFGMPLGTARVVRGDLGAYVVRVIGRTPYDPVRFQTEQQTLRQDLLRRKQQEMMQTWVRQIQRIARIQDLRPLTGS